MRDYLKNNDISIKSGTDVNFVMRDMMSVLLEGVLDEELNEELGYSRYDYRNKDTDNSRNEYFRKTMHTSYGDMDIAIPRDLHGEYEPQVIKRLCIQQTLLRVSTPASERLPKKELSRTKTHSLNYSISELPSFTKNGTAARYRIGQWSEISSQSTTK